MTLKPKVKDAARGCWKAVLPKLGIAAHFLTGKHGPCPMCEGHDRWRFDDKDGDGTWICSHCGAGDGIKLVMISMKLDFREAAQCVEANLKGVEPAAPSPKNDTDGRAEMNKVWQSARPLDLTTVAGRYLNARTGLEAFCADLRGATSLPHFVKDEKIPTKHPGLVAKVRGADGQPVNIHRTYLDPDGGKAKVDPPRKVMKGPLPAGSAIRLAAHEDILGIAEGIESALSATVLHHVPCWAAVTAVMLEQWRPPEGVRVIVFGDNDPNYTGHKSAYALAHRLAMEKVRVDVMIPERLGDDWNDVLMRQMNHREAAAA